jgi:hypothetical protein
MMLYTIQDLKEIAAMPGILYIAAWHDIGAMVVFHKEDNDETLCSVLIDVFDSERFDDGTFSVHTGCQKKDAWFIPGGQEYSKYNGCIKWDGCSNWDFDTYTHFCGCSDVVNFGELLKRCYQIAWTLMPRGDAADFTPPPLPATAAPLTPPAH